MTSSRVAKARPNLGDVYPFYNSIVILFIIFNFFLAQYIYLARPDTGLAVFNIFNNNGAYIWSVVFALLAITLLWGKIKNDWAFMRGAMIAGLFVKALFLVSLITLLFKTGFKATESIIILWTFATAVQFTWVMYFNSVIGS